MEREIKIILKHVLSGISIGAGIILVILGLIGIFLPLIPGIILIILGLWLINKEVNIHPIRRLLNHLRRIKNKTKLYIQKKRIKRLNRIKTKSEKVLNHLDTANKK
ncbi:MAG: hypothetical protein QXG00_05220 [Candidatus Woesearchaeota archaeon]